MGRDSPGFDAAGAEAAILAYLARTGYQPLLQRELLHQMQIPGPQRPAVRRLLREMFEQGKIRKQRGGRIAAADRFEPIVGVLQRHREGYGFVVPDDGDEDVFVAARHVGSARTGDRVAVRVTSGGGEQRLNGVIVSVLESRSGEVLGVYRGSDRGGSVHPFDPAVGEPLQIPARLAGTTRDMQAVLARRVQGAGPGGEGQAEIVEVLGHLDEPGTDVAVVVRKYGLAVEFSEEALRQAEGLPQRIGSRAAEGRTRFDDPDPVTIDGETAKDFDDAVAVVELPGGGWRLFVHIADVGHFVEPDSPLDIEARGRGVSVYFPGTVLPMFPETLSNGLCSLRPEVDRLVQTAILDFDVTGKPGEVTFADGIIRSAARLTYTQVSGVLSGEGAVHGVPGRVVPMLHAANRLREVLEKRRHARGSVDFDLPEPQILLDVEGVMTGITIEPRNEAHRLIEEFMLAANEAVASFLERHEADCLYRVHEPPDPTKVAALSSFVEGFGLKMGKRRDRIESRDIQDLLERVEGRPEARVVAQVALRSMSQARYSTDNVGHFGLASPTYCHFTSPIRRYPDLEVHRELRRLRHGRKRRRGDDAPSPEAVAQSCSQLERSAESAERELLNWKKISFIADRTGETFDGVVTGVARFGLFVQLIENLVEGLVRIETLGREYFEYVESRFQLVGSRSGKTFRLGDRLRVRVDRVDRALLRVDLAIDDERPAGAQAAPSAARRAAPGKRRAQRDAGKRGGRKPGSRRR